MICRNAVLWTAAIVLIMPLGLRAADKDQDAMQGIWSVESAKRGGQEMPAETRTKLKLEFKGNEAIVHREDEKRPAEFTIDPAKSPKTIKIKPKQDGEREVTGIYEINGDTLRICVVEGDGEVPTKFESPEGSKTRLLVLKREKK